MGEHFKIWHPWAKRWFIWCIESDQKFARIGDWDISVDCPWCESEIKPISCLKSKGRLKGDKTIQP